MSIKAVRALRLYQESLDCGGLTLWKLRWRLTPVMKMNKAEEREVRVKKMMARGAKASLKV